MTDRLTPEREEEIRAIGQELFYTRPLDSVVHDAEVSLLEGHIDNGSDRQGLLWALGKYRGAIQSLLSELDAVREERDRFTKAYEQRVMETIRTVEEATRSFPIGFDDAIVMIRRLAAERDKYHNAHFGLVWALEQARRHITELPIGYPCSLMDTISEALSESEVEWLDQPSPPHEWWDVNLRGAARLVYDHSETSIARGRIDWARPPYFSGDIVSGTVKWLEDCDCNWSPAPPPPKPPTDDDQA